MSAGPVLSRTLPATATDRAWLRHSRAGGYPARACVPSTVSSARRSASGAGLGGVDHDVQVAARHGEHVTVPTRDCYVHFKTAATLPVERAPTAACSALELVVTTQPADEPPCPIDIGLNRVVAEARASCLRLEPLQFDQQLAERSIVRLP